MKHLPSILLYIGVTAALLVHAKPIFAQNFAEGFAMDIRLDEKNVPEGSIVSLAKGKYLMSDIPYDPSIIGVVTDNPSVAFIDENSHDSRHIASLGKTKVRVSTINGEIKAGDLITSSSIRGVGQKATESGYILGVALESYDQKDPKKEGTIYLSVHMNFGTLTTNLRQNLFATLRKGFLTPFVSPVNALRYVIAGLVAILSFLGGFWFFGRISSRGVEAIGRNPLARRFIIISILINVSLTIVVMLLGVGIAYIILVI
jgi:hypothetical protein